MQKHICFILDFYPTPDNLGCVFAKNLIYAIAEKGIKCTVISPQAITPGTLKARRPFYRTETVSNGGTVDIYMPYYLYLKAKKPTVKMSMDNHFRSAMGIIKKYNIKPDAVYGHFLFQCGLTASRIGKKLGIPSYCACGENSTRLATGSEPYATGLKYGNFRKIADELTGIVSVSSYNKRLLIDNDFVSENANIGVFPNGIDESRFYKKDKAEMREKLGLPQDKFVVAFNGDYSERKGFRVLCEALSNFDDVYSIFIGSDTVKPDAPNVLFSARLQPEIVPDYLSAADIFVLPTLGEGCCNAIVEALACGLPVVSSSLPFNDDLLSDGNSIRVNPTDVTEIAMAIEKLKSDKALCDTMSHFALQTAENLHLGDRTDKILEFMGFEQ